MSDEELFVQEPPSFWDRLWNPETGPSYWVARFLIVRLLGVVYFIGFLTVIDQALPLLGSDGLTPAADYLGRIETTLGSRSAGFVQFPSIFWFRDSDRFLVRVALLGAGASLLVVFGYANAITLTFLWFLYMSYVHIGQVWYGFGWEIQLLETGFLAIFLCPLLDGRPFPARPPPVVVIWLYRWLIFRIMLGAGLIKLRGDACWADLTCLAYHYETQPVPNPLSRWLHFMPLWLHKLGVLANHLSEIVAPFFAFDPRRARHVAGVVLVGFQVMLIMSGNLSFLNWLTIIPALACFDDTFFAWVIPDDWKRRLARQKRVPYHRAQQVAATALFVVVALGSLGPVANMLSSRQVMNTSFGPLHIVNTYGAFGSVSKERYELVFEGREEGSDVWRAYELPCKPTSVDRRPCIITPYHYRLDWLLWFAAMGRVEQYPWTANLVWKLLQNDASALSLLASNPFSEAPPHEIRIELYRYRFAPFGEDAWWTRERLRSWLPATKLTDRKMRDFLRRQGW